MCTGNQCRSALAAPLFNQRAVDLPATAESAGTLEIPPTAPPAPMIEVGRALGVDLTGHRSRPLSHTEPATFDLVLGFELDHVAVAFAEHGVPADRAFLLTEFVRLAASDVVPDGSEDHARAVIESAGRCRSGNFQPDQEVEDPIGKNRRAYETAGREIDHLTQELVEVLFGSRADTPQD